MVVQSQFIEMFSGREYPQLPIRDFADITTGSTPSKSHPEYWGGGNPWVSAEDMKDKYVYDTVEKVTDKGYATCKHIPVNTLMYVCRGSIGVMAINKVECATNQSICTATCKADKCEVEFLYHSLLYKKDEIKQIGIGTNFKSLNQTTFSNLRISLPPIEEQRHFVSITTQADKSKFDGLKSQFIEDYFNRYESTSLGPFISVIRGVSYKPADIKESAEDGVTILRSNNISDGEINYDDLVFVSDSCVSQKQYLRSGDIVMCGSNGSKKLVGKAGLITSEHGNTSFGAFCLGIRCNDNLSPEYLNTYFNSDMYRSIIEELGNGTNIINIRPDHITSLAIPIPNMEAQKRFVSMSRQADKSKYLS